jgi:hypothetical protein
LRCFLVRLFIKPKTFDHKIRSKIGNMSEMVTLLAFLNTLELNPNLAKIKTVEVDLRGALNPTIWLHQTFFEQKNYLGFRAFYEYYLQKNEPLLRTIFADMDWGAVEKGLEARLYRTQFGMLTEYHAYFLCKTVFGAANVLRNTDLDRSGVDFQIQHHTQLYNIHIFVDTDRAWAYRNYKIQNKQSNKITGLHLNLPYSLRSGQFNSLVYLSNGFGVYSEAYLAYLKNEMELGNIKNNNIIGTNATGFIYQPS